MDSAHITKYRKWSGLNGKQRWQYFLDYYLLYTVCIIGITAIILFLGWHFLKPKEKNILYVAVLDESLNEKATAQLRKSLEEKFGADGKNESVLIDDSFYSREDGIHKLEVYVRNRQVDIVIAPQEIFDMLSGFGFMQDAKTVLGEKAGNYTEKFYRAAGYKETEEVSFEDHETGQGEVKDYGICLAGSSVYRKLKPMTEEPVFGFVVDMPNKENAVKFFEILEE